MSQPDQKQLFTTILNGWSHFQQTLSGSLAPLNADQLALHAGSNLRPVHTIAAHIIGARARWMFGLDEQPEWKSYRGWDRPGASARSAAELVAGLETTWQMLRQAVEGWTAEQWAQTLEDDGETVTRQWVVWHLLEHDLFHGGEISVTLGAHQLRGLDL